ncbi:hypothetical protein ACFPJ1_19505 [Kribbella qitaiheensis]|uniref:hypothetical protein n=1 Tax=Kribbella qitaiheensis TaxID=1544730 RepID=UPI0036148890
MAASDSEHGQPGDSDQGPRDRRTQFLSDRGLPDDDDFYHPASQDDDEIDAVTDDSVPQQDDSESESDDKGSLG